MLIDQHHSQSSADGVPSGRSLAREVYPVLRRGKYILHALRLHYSSITIQNKDDLVYHLTAHLRMNAIYWGLTALCVMDHKDALNRDEMIEFVMSCWDEEAGLF